MRSILISALLITGVIMFSAESPDSLSVNNSQYYSEFDFFIISLSPNGKYALVTLESGRTAVANWRTGEIVVKAPEDFAGFDITQLEWSPDSSMLAVTENFFRYQHDSDLWIFHVPEKKVLHLMDDGLDKNNYNPFGSDMVGEAVYQPVWSPDSKALIFSVSEYGKYNTKFFQLTDIGTTNKIEYFYTLEEDMPYITWQEMVWRNDSLYFTYDHSTTAYEKDGIYRLNLKSQELEILVSASELEADIFLIDCNEEGSRLIFSKFGFDKNLNTVVFTYFVYDLKSKRTWKFFADSKTSFNSLLFYSETGILYLSISFQDSKLSYLDTVTGTLENIYGFREPPGSFNYYSSTINLAIEFLLVTKNNTALIILDNGSMILELQLESDD